RRPRVRGAVCAADGHDSILPRPLLAGAPSGHGGPGDLLALRRRHVDHRVHRRVRHLGVALDPFRKEADAFRVLLYLVAVVAAIVVVVLVVRAISSLYAKKSPTLHADAATSPPSCTSS